MQQWQVQLQAAAAKSAASPSCSTATAMLLPQRGIPRRFPPGGQTMGQQQQAVAAFKPCSLLVALLQLTVV